MPPAPEDTSGVTAKEASTHILLELSADEIMVDGHVYSSNGLAAIHPGGDMFVKAFAGRDATEAFLSYHRKPFPHSSQRDYLLRAILPGAGKMSNTG
jgi:cytochrome b involved in lipid metabolism